MPSKKHIFGPANAITYGGVPLGRTDGTGSVDFEIVHRVIPIATDQSGGAESDYIQQDDIVLLPITLIEWDEAVVNSLRSALTVNAGAPALAADGVSSTPGLLRYENYPVGGTNPKRLVITPIKQTALSGFAEYTFGDAIQDPQTPIRISKIGNVLSTLSLVIRCRATGFVPTLYTTRNVT